MNSISRRRTFQSPHNGLIVCDLIDGAWRVCVNGFDQSSVYTTNMWRDALARLPNADELKHVLLLGLGAGSIIAPLHKQIPSCLVDAIEWDSVMAGLGLGLDIYSPTHQPTILVGDALEILPTLQSSYDLIICDLFLGPETATAMVDPSFSPHISRLLSPNGMFLLNAFKHHALFAHFEKSLNLRDIWTFDFNRLGLFECK